MYLMLWLNFTINILPETPHVSLLLHELLSVMHTFLTDRPLCCHNRTCPLEPWNMS